MFFPVRFITVKSCDDVDELFAIPLGRSLGEDLVRALQQEGREVDVRLFSGIGPVMLEQEIEGHMEVVRNLLQRFVVRFAYAAFITVVGGLTDMERIGELRLCQSFFFTKIAQAVVLHGKSPFVKGVSPLLI